MVLIDNDTETSFSICSGANGPNPFVQSVPDTVSRRLSQSRLLHGTQQVTGIGGNRSRTGAAREPRNSRSQIADAAGSRLAPTGRCDT
jgi:hypothetical protein